MKEELCLWRRVTENKKYDIYKVIEDESGLTLRLISEDDGITLGLHWDVLVCAYRNIDESFWIDKLEELISLYGESFITSNTFFFVKNSAFSKEVENGCKKTIRAENMFHLKIISSNSIFDVVSLGEPKVFKSRY